MPTRYPMAIEPGSRYPAWPWQGAKTEKNPLSSAAKLWKAFKRERQRKDSVASLATWNSLERSNAKRHTRSSTRNPLNLTVQTSGNPVLKQRTTDISPSSSTTRSRSTTQASVFSSTPPSPADSATTYEPASSTEDLIVMHPAKYQISDTEDTDTEFWYDGIVPEDRSFPGAYDDSSSIRPFTPVEGLTPNLSLRDFPAPPSLLPYIRPTYPELRGSLRSSTQSRPASTLRAAVLRKSRSYDSQSVNSVLGSAPGMQRRESKPRISPATPPLKPPKPLQFSKRSSNQSQISTGRFVYTTSPGLQRTPESQRKRESHRHPSMPLTNYTSRRSNNTHQESHLMRHILSALQVQEDWEQDGDSIREYFARKPSLNRSSIRGPGLTSRSRYTDDAMTARKRLLESLQGNSGRISGGMDTATDPDGDVEDLFGVCTGHFRSVMSATLSLDSSVGGRDSKSFSASRAPPISRGSDRISFGRETERGAWLGDLQWCEVIDLREYFIEGDHR